MASQSGSVKSILCAENKHKECPGATFEGPAYGSCECACHFPKIDIWFIDASTGCSCCDNENFQAGPFKSEQEAQERSDIYTRERRLASQYSKTGRYHIHKEEGELLPDGRIICGGSVYEGIEERAD